MSDRSTADRGDALRFVRASTVRVLEHRDGVLLLGDDGSVRRFDPDAAGLVRATLEFLVRPQSRASLLAHIESLAGAPVENPAVIDELVATLRAAGAVRVHGHATTETRAALHAPEPEKRLRVVLGITGAVGSMHAPALVDRLQSRGYDVWPVLTRTAHRFVRAQALEALTHHRVHRSLWSGAVGEPAPHIALAQWADLVLVCPASATTIGRMAHAGFDDLVSAVAQTALARVPVLVVPSMNPAMYGAPSVQRALELLRDDGVHVVMPGLGHEVAEAPAQRAMVLGPAPSWETVVALVGALLATRPRVAPVDAAVPALDEAAAWDARYAQADPTSRPWECDAVDEPSLEALTRACAAPGPVLDLGCGTGVFSVALASRGYAVTAIDLSPRALEQARARWARVEPSRRHGGSLVCVRGDVRDALFAGGGFLAAHDRACMHVLLRDEHTRYLRSVRAMLDDRAVFVLTVHDARDPRARALGTHGYTADALRECVHGGTGFAVEAIEESWMRGPAGVEPARALRATLRALP